MATQIQVDLKHETHGALQTVVECDGSVDEGQYAELDRQARKNAASRYVDYASFGGDSAYLERLDEVADEFTVTDMTVLPAEGESLIRFSVRAEYSHDEAGEWEDWVHAPNEDAARFDALQTLAENERTSRDDPDEFQLTMESCTIKEIFAEPVTKEEALAIVREYQALHDGLSDMIEGGRLNGGHIPDDYRWLVESLERIGNLPGNEPAKQSAADHKARVHKAFEDFEAMRLGRASIGTLEALAKEARPQPVFPDAGGERNGGDDWGSERQIAAQNKFFEEVEKVLTTEQFEALEGYCLKANTDEMINEGLRMARGNLEFNNTQASQEGWAIFTCHGSENGDYQICRDDEANVFPSDDDAWLHVVTQAKAGSAYHQSALDYIRDVCPIEWASISKAHNL